MAEESQQSRTEQATPRRLEKAQQEGQVAYSTDFVSAITLLLMSIVLMVFSDALFKSLMDSLHRFSTILAQPKPEIDWVPELIMVGAIDFLKLCFPISVLTVFAIVLSAGFMTGFKTSPKAFKWDAARLHPASGAKKLFSSRSVVRGLTATGKFIVLLAISLAVMYQQGKYLVLVDTHVESLVRFGWALMLRLSFSVSGGLIAIGLIDLLFQKWKHAQDLRMTRQEVLDEHREDEGDPHMRARRKKIQRERLQHQSSLRDVADATVVVTNPTHFAVALKYDRQTMNAPRVVAKGADHRAFRIIAIAKKHRVEVVERKPLARALYKSVPIGAEIPLELFQAVAEVISYVYSRKRAA